MSAQSPAVLSVPRSEHRQTSVTLKKTTAVAAGADGNNVCKDAGSLIQLPVGREGGRGSIEYLRRWTALLARVPAAAFSQICDGLLAVRARGAVKTTGGYASTKSLPRKLTAASVILLAVVMMVVLGSLRPETIASVRKFARQ